MVSKSTGEEEKQVIVLKIFRSYELLKSFRITYRLSIYLVNVIKEVIKSHIVCMIFTTENLLEGTIKIHYY